MLLNCDLGELEDREHRIERALMPLIDLANIACGMHAGGPLSIHNTLKIAKDHGVAIGAHPGYCDRDNFGGVSIPHTPEELTALLHYQIGALEGMARNRGMALDYIKPHGALYNDMMANEDILKTVLASLGEQQGPRKLMLLATADAEKHRRLAGRYNVKLLFETFADRRYTDSGFLVPRGQPGAVLDQTQMLEQVQQLCEDGRVTTASGRTLPIEADTLCIHGDTPDAVETIGRIRATIKDADR